MLVSLGLVLSACGSKQVDGDVLFPTTTPLGQRATATSIPTETSLPTPVPRRVLTVCLGREPASLFLYEANSFSAQGVLAAVYDTPLEMQSEAAEPMILTKIPSLAGGDAVLQPVEVNPGEQVVDASGSPVLLAQGVVYRPSGCTQTSCSLTYSGDQAVWMDQLSLRFTLLDGLQWSDGAPLSADDSLYSYEVARALYPAAIPELLARTADYRLLDELSVEWLGLPGYVDSQLLEKFFSPLPRHAWGATPAQQLTLLEAATRTPLGWGPYVIEEWTPGDHISLRKNPLYFRSGEGLPFFDFLVYRFVSNGTEALAALLAGECDLVDQTAGLDSQSVRLRELQDASQIQAVFQNGAGWELLQFGINSLEEERPAVFAAKEVRQAVAMCLDWQSLAAAVGDGMLPADLYLLPEHPLYNAQAAHYDHDPQRAAELLTQAGWLDLDNDPSTPRTAQGAQGVADGTPFTVELLAAEDPQRQAMAQQVQRWLAVCGIQVDIVSQPFQDYLAPGPEGAVFGRRFDLAQVAWSSSGVQACRLYLTNEIPGPYPAYPRGWGGANAAGFSDPAFDAACWDSLYALDEWAQQENAQAEAQAIFAEQLPALPLFWYFKVLAARPDFCGLPSQVSSALEMIEQFNYGEACSGQ